MSDQPYSSNAAGLYANVGEWSNRTFGNEESRGPVGPLKHLAKEVLGELLGFNRKLVDSFLESMAVSHESAKSKEEMADVLILLCDAARRAGHTWDELVAAGHEKMAVNRTRTYPKPVGDQVSEHDRSKDAKPHPIPKEIVDPFAMQAEVMREAVHIDAEGRMVAPPENARKIACPFCRQLVAIVNREGIARYHAHEKSKGSRCGHIGNT